MNGDEVRAVLGYLSSIDGRLRRRDRREADMLAQAWTRQITDLELAPVMAAIDAHYSRPDAEIALPGDVAGVVRAAQQRAHRDRVERTAATSEAAALCGVDPDDVNAYRAALQAARGIPQPAQPADARRLRAVSSGSVPPADPAQELCHTWVRMWRTVVGADRPLPPLTFAAHVGAEITRLVGGEITYADCVRRVEAAAARGVCLCGRRRTETPTAPLGAGEGARDGGQ